MRKLIRSINQMSRVPSSLAAAFMVSSLALAMGCKRAGYEFVPPDILGESGDRVQPIDTGTGDGESSAPRAGVEIVKDGKKVDTAKRGESMTVRPTLDTADGDNIGESNCVNPGIVKADYDLGNGDARSVTRTDRCSSLDIAYVWPVNGTFTVTLTVTSDEGETATAKTTVVVSDSGGQNCVTPPGGGACIPPGQQPPSQRPSQRPGQRST